MSTDIELVKSKLDIVDVVSRYITLKKRGRHHVAPCPFHQEKTPSFVVSPELQIYKCFGCGKGGDIFTFVEEFEGLDFKGALKILADKAGVQLKRENIELRTQRQRLYEICELACCFFEKQLGQSRVGNKAKEYLLNRGQLVSLRQ